MQFEDKSPVYQADSLGTLSLSELQNYDSVSMQSSVADSEFVESEIRRFEAQNHGQVTQVLNEPINNQINFQISLITPPTNERSRQLHQSIYNAEGILETKKSSPFPRNRNNHYLQKPVVWICLITFIYIVIGSIIGVIVLNNLNISSKNDIISDDFTSVATFLPTSISAPTTPAETSETVTLPHVKPEPFSFFNRSQWKALRIKGKIKLKLPVKRLILMDTQTETCSNVEDCKVFMQKRQNDSYSSRVQDIPENFLIASDGSIYEGRGFSHEGQHTFDAGTSYNKEAIGISFIGNYTTNELSSDQKESLQYFVTKFIKEGNVRDDCIVYYKLQLIKSSVTDDNLYEYIRKLNNWKQSPRIFRRSEWQAAMRSGVNDFTNTFNIKTVISHSGNSSCFELSECIDQLKQRQQADKPKYGDIKHNFVLAGNDYIFEGRSFDISDSASGGLKILFIGNFMDVLPPQTLMNQLEIFLNYSVDLGKLTENYEILGEKQIVYDTKSPGDKLYERLQKPPFDLHFNFNKSEAEKCSFGCLKSDV